MFSVTFAGYHVQPLIVRGTNLRKFYNAIAAHRLCTFLALDRAQFESKEEPVVSEIKIERVESESP